MGYYMRYFVEDARVPSLTDIASAYADHPSGARVFDDQLRKGDATHAEFTVSPKGDELFEEEIEEFRAELADAESGPAKRRVAKCLQNAQAIVAVQVLGGGAVDDSLDLLGPFWDYMDRTYRGLIQADGEGFYDGDDLILEL
jgi:hypothetical protein